MRVKYAAESIQDLTRIRQFIAKKNPVAAARIGTELLHGIDKLKAFPQIGLPVRHALEAELIRDLFVGHYTVRYLISTSQITVLRIWHGKEIEKDL